MSSCLNRVRDKYGKVSYIVLENNFLRLSFGVKTGTIDIEPSSRFCDFMLKHNSVYTMECFYDEVVMMLKNKFNTKPLMLNDELITVLDIEVDMIIMKYIHRFDIVCMYNLERSNESR